MKSTTSWAAASSKPSIRRLSDASFQGQGIPFQEKPEIELCYKGTRLDQTYQPDFLCYDQIIVELKAAKMLADDHRAQTINYLKATRKKLGLLVNFGHYPKLESERLVK